MGDIQPSDKAEQVFFEIHQDNPREGPGCFEATSKAFSMLTDLPGNPLILDIGCGPGRQTLDLAKLTGGCIYAIDNHEPFLLALQKKIDQMGLSERVFAQWGDMRALQFSLNNFELMWAEGCIYIMGFEQGLTAWKPFLKKNGYIAVTEVTWLRANPPTELLDFWQQAYPAMLDVTGNISIIEKAGYRLIEHFTLPASAWWDDYYSHIEKKLPGLRLKFQGNTEAMAVIEMEQFEMEIFRKYHDYYGYCFYIMQKP